MDELLELVGLTGWADRYPSQLSGGQRQRMALARALAVQPRVLLLDEPFGALDANVRQELREWLRRLHDEVHVTTVLVTHDQEEAMEVADRIVVLDGGRVQQSGPPRELYERPANAVRDEVPRAGVGARRPLRPPARSGVVVGSGRGCGRGDGRRAWCYLGFEVRVELELAPEGAVSVQLTRGEADELEVRRETSCGCSPSVRAPAFSA